VIAGLGIAYQPIVDLRDGSTVGYEALLRGPQHTPLERPDQLFAAARAEDRVAELDLVSRDAAIRRADRHGLTAPFSLFVNADADTLLEALPERPAARSTLLVDISEAAVVARPEALLRALSRLRTLGWGIALDDIGADSRSLALMPLLYPDVIKLDLRLLTERDRSDIARVVTAVGFEAERRHATVLAEGIDSDAALATARAAGATLGQGFHLGKPGPLPEPLPEPGRPLRLAGTGGAPDGPLPYQRVTNWRRPTRGTPELAERAAALLSGQATALGETGMLLAAPPGNNGLAARVRYTALSGEIGFLGVLSDGVLEGTWTEVALGPGYGACFVAQRDGDEWLFATSYDRELVVECALLLMARLPGDPARS
jgi:EAL domain-containing protein (putative c-di-GMP-specific phosphodiesterase class I)